MHRARTVQTDLLACVRAHLLACLPTGPLTCSLTQVLRALTERAQFSGSKRGGWTGAEYEEQLAYCCAIAALIGEMVEPRLKHTSELVDALLDCGAHCHLINLMQAEDADRWARVTATAHQSWAQPPQQLVGGAASTTSNAFHRFDGINEQVRDTLGDTLLATLHEAACGALRALLQYPLETMPSRQSRSPPSSTVSEEARQKEAMRRGARAATFARRRRAVDAGGIQRCSSNPGPHSHAHGQHKPTTPTPSRYDLELSRSPKPQSPHAGVIQVLIAQLIRYDRSRKGLQLPSLSRSAAGLYEVDDEWMLSSWLYPARAGERPRALNAPSVATAAAALLTSLFDDDPYEHRKRERVGLNDDEGHDSDEGEAEEYSEQEARMAQHTLYMERRAKALQVSGVTDEWLTQWDL